MPTKKLIALSLFSIATLASAQTTNTPANAVAAPTEIPGGVSATAAKPTVETATTPVEQIKINGTSLPLNIKTLAEMQRLAEEKALREQIQEALSTGGAVKIPASNLQPAAPVAATSTTATPEAVKPASTIKRAKPAVASNTLMAVYGPSGNLKAEIFMGKKQVRHLQKGDSFGDYRVASISQNGVQLEPVGRGRSSKFVSVGQSLTN